jgi:transcription termination factor Rho
MLKMGLWYCNCIDGNWFKMDEVIFEEFKGTGNGIAVR